MIAKDVSFADVVSPELRGLLTWNRTSLLPALPKSRSTVSQYVVNTLAERKKKIKLLLTSSKSKISLSLDI